MEQKSKSYLNIVLITTLIAWVNAFVALWHRQGILTNGINEKSFCKIGEAFDCDAAALSSFSSLAGYPISALGMVAYTLVLIIGFMIFFNLSDSKIGQARGLAKVLFYLSLLGLAPTLALALVTILYIKTICLMCTASYVLNIVLFVFSLLLLKSLTRTGSETPPLKSLFNTPFYIVFGLSAVLQLFVPKILEINLGPGAELNEATENLYLNDHLTEKVHNFDFDTSPQKGPATAPVTIVEFSDMQCPACARSARTLPPLLKSYGDKIHYVYKNFPLDSSCNSSIKGSMHPAACLAAKTGYCLFKLKGSEIFFNFKFKMFEEQSKMNPDFVRSEALAQGVDGPALDACVNDPATHQKIVDDVNGGIDAKVNGTPSLFINGRYLRTGPQPKILKRVIDHYLSQ